MLLSIESSFRCIPRASYHNLLSGSDGHLGQGNAVTPYCTLRSRVHLQICLYTAIRPGQGFGPPVLPSDRSSQHVGHREVRCSPRSSQLRARFPPSSAELQTFRSLATCAPFRADSYLGTPSSHLPRSQRQILDTTGTRLTEQSAGSGGPRPSRYALRLACIPRPSTRPKPTCARLAIRQMRPRVDRNATRYLFVLSSGLSPAYSAVGKAPARP
ncbi:hypothetical protein OH76DRAFT_537993 [Lentinus brumalis]|uniref:Uncharacterized protein n=1 Tax=Lentinus brumalis TaxID=2498619 RepID=A0A371CHN2_9APHY|nr:hypothetical protein OH76DRAFT_537993 [Polyporus brumalis]